MDINISRIIEQVLDRRELDKPRDYIGASIIGNDCERAIWYSSNGYTESHVDSRIKRIFDTGNLWEKLLLDYLELSDIKLVRPDKENNYLECHDKDLSYFKGHMDALMIFPEPSEVVILDIKTAKNIEFNKFKSQGLRMWKPNYYAQLQAYMGMTGYKFSSLLAFNKDDQKLHDETVPFNEIFYRQLKEKARKIYNLINPPERINKSPFYYKCSYCNFKTTCHSQEKTIGIREYLDKEHE